MWKDFKEFALKGNVMDMAIGVIIGGAFGKIVTSLVSDIIMPLLGMLTRGINFSKLKFILSPAVMEGTTVVTPENAINYGLFLDNILNFFIIAFCIFVVIRILNQAKNKLSKKTEDIPEEKPATPSSEELLAEIRDLLKEKQV